MNDKRIDEVKILFESLPYVAEITSYPTHLDVITTKYGRFNLQLIENNWVVIFDHPHIEIKIREEISHEGLLYKFFNGNELEQYFIFVSKKVSRSVAYTSLKYILKQFDLNDFECKVDDYLIVAKYLNTDINIFVDFDKFIISHDVKNYGKMEYNIMINGTGRGFRVFNDIKKLIDKSNNNYEDNKSI